MYKAYLLSIYWTYRSVIVYLNTTALPLIRVVIRKLPTSLILWYTKP